MARPRTSVTALGWGEGVSRPDHRIVRTPDGAELAVWDLAGRRSRRAGGRAPPLLGLQPRDLAPRRPSPPRAGLPGRALRPARPRVEHERDGAAGHRDAGARPDGSTRGDRRARRRAGGALHGRHDDHVAGHAPARGASGAGQGDRARRDGGHEPSGPFGAGRHEWPGRWWRRLSSPGRMQSKNGHLFVRCAFGDESGPGARGPDPGPLRRLPRRRAGRLLAVDSHDGPPRRASPRSRCRRR